MSCPSKELGYPITGICKPDSYDKTLWVLIVLNMRAICNYDFWEDLNPLANINQCNKNERKKLG